MRFLTRLAGFGLVFCVVLVTWLYLPSFAFSAVKSPPPVRSLTPHVIHHATGQILGVDYRGRAGLTPYGRP